MSKSILIGIVLIVLLVIVGGLYLVTLQSSATNAQSQQQHIIETSNAVLDATARAISNP